MVALKHGGHVSHTSESRDDSDFPLLCSDFVVLCSSALPCRVHLVPALQVGDVYFCGLNIYSKVSPGCSL